MSRIAVVVVAMLSAPILRAQQPAPAFVVASVKYLGEQVEPTPPTQTAPNVYYARGATVASLVQAAYGLQRFQLVGGPDWARTSRFEIHAKAAAPFSAEQKWLMVQSLLKDRFKLVVRREPQEMDFLALRMTREDSRPGPKLRSCLDPEKGPEPTPYQVRRGVDYLRSFCRPMSDIAQRATAAMRRPVVDKTGLTGLWTYLMEYSSPLFMNPRGEPLDETAANMPAFPIALREELGLTLEATRGPVDVLVIDQVERPTPD